MTHFINREKWNLLYVLWVTFIISIFFGEAVNLNSRELFLRIFCTFFFSIIVYSLSLFTSGWYKRLYFILVLIVFVVPAIVVMSGCEVDKSLLKGNDFWFVFQTNLKESEGFVGANLNVRLTISIILYLLASVILLVKITTAAAVNVRKKGALLSVMGAIVLSAGIYCAGNRPDYVIDFYGTLHNFIEELRQYDNHKNDRLITDKSALRMNLPDSVPKTFVVILGESFTRRHMSLYGYKRKTSPLLDSMGGRLMVFTNVIASELQTSPSLKKVLTFSNENPEYFFRKPSIIDLFNSLHFSTYWIDNQFDGPFNNSADIFAKIAKTAGHCLHLNCAAPDESILVPLKDILAKKEETSQFIMIHMMGCHVPYERRYPKSFERFTDTNGIQTGLKSRLNAGHMKIINDYDNSIVYNDFVILSIIRAVEAKKGINYVLFFPDHGEEVFDYRIYAGRSYDNITPDMYEIPFILWLSDAYRKLRPLSIDPDRPYSISDVIHTIIDLSSFSYEQFDSTRSVISEHFRKRPRDIRGKILQENPSSPATP
jgi:heptose-I-phosphate ethanolaminephosphotransferase